MNMYNKLNAKSLIVWEIPGYVEYGQIENFFISVVDKFIKSNKYRISSFDERIKKPIKIKRLIRIKHQVRSLSYHVITFSTEVHAQIAKKITHKNLFGDNMIWTEFTNSFVDADIKRYDESHRDSIKSKGAV